MSAARRSYDPNVEPLNRILRAQYAMDDDWIAHLFAEAAVCHVASVWDDQPFLTPLNFWFRPEPHEIIFHTNLTGRLRANLERNPRVCIEVSRHGEFLPAETALDFTVEYQSAVAYGPARVLQDPEDKREALYGLLHKHFPNLRPGIDYASISDQELVRTSVYAVKIEQWSGKSNWERDSVGGAS
jgi:nitroimidazol reductase NimA-like FMN-containing flavoprotein (pyridoxamine 5'-phosphate oxidase superfamily)